MTDINNVLANSPTGLLGTQAPAPYSADLTAQLADDAQLAKNTDPYAETMPPVQPAASQTVGGAIQGGQGDYITKALSQIQQNTQAIVDAKKKAQDGFIAAHTAELARAPAFDLNQLQKLPQYAPPQVDQHAVQNYAGVMMLFAAIAGRFTSTPLTTALNAFSSSMLAEKQGQKDKAQQYKDEFKANIDKAVYENKLATEKYKIVMEQHQSDLATMQVQLKYVAEGFDDQLAVQALNQKGVLGLEQILSHRDILAEQARFHSAEIDKWNTQIADQVNYRKAMQDGTLLNGYNAAIADGALPKGTTFKDYVAMVKPASSTFGTFGGQSAPAVLSSDGIPVIGDTSAIPTTEENVAAPNLD